MVLIVIIANSRDFAFANLTFREKLILNTDNLVDEFNFSKYRFYIKKISNTEDIRQKVLSNEFSPLLMLELSSNFDSEAFLYHSK